MTFCRCLVRLACIGLGIVLCPAAVSAADWPMWRYDAGRSAASPHDLPAPLHLQWVRELAPLKPAWPDQPKMQFDAAYEPIVAGKLLIVGSSRNDGVTAYDTATGIEKWTYHPDGPVRFAPAAADGRICFVCDDGYLYCLDADKGRLEWKFRGGPTDRKILGNERLISTWPARGAPVVADGRVYFAAGIWPFMGIFIHCLDARTGEVVWTNDGDGSIHIRQPHNADSFAGVAPQGPLVIAGANLLVPGGRSIPACYDLKTGKFLRYQLAENGKRGGGSGVSAIGNLFFNGGAAFELSSQKFLGAFPEHVVLTKDVLYGSAKDTCTAYDLKSSSVKIVETVDRKGNPLKVAKWKIEEKANTKMPPTTAFIKAGKRLYVGSPDQLTAIDLPLKNGKQPAWQTTIDGTPASLLAADERLFAATREGRICCFGAEKRTAKTHAWKPAPPEPADAWTDKARAILETTKVREGYCVAWGIASGRLVTEIARQSSLRIIVVDPSIEQVNAFRAKLIAAGLYGERVSVHAGDPLTYPLPPYLASLMICEDLEAAGIDANAAFAQRAFQALRPYGGVACLQIPSAKRQAIVEAKLASARITDTAVGLLLAREGALPGAANWTHEHADASNTRVSKDQLVKAPLGVLWFGGPSHDGILPRHGHGPQPQVIDGRLIIEGIDMLRAMDIYTGRILWETRLPGVGAFYNNLAHQPGANSSGTNFISMSDGIYVVYGTKCYRLDPATGKRMSDFTLPPVGKVKGPPRWGYINVVDDVLIGGADPIYDPKLKVIGPGDDPDPFAPKDEKKDDKKKESALSKLLKGLNNDNLSSSKHLVVMDRHTGKVWWTASAQSGFRHNAICTGGGRLYAIDRLSGPEAARLKRRGEEPKTKPRLVVFDLKTGKQLWSTDADVFGTWLSYSAKHDVVVESGRVARDTISDEPKGMRAYRAAKGKILWFNKKYAGPAMIHGDTILKDTSACDLLTGTPKMREHPLTGAPVAWTWFRNYGCNTPAASEHLLTFRSGAAGYFDLCHDGGTGNFGGFRSSCTNNLIVAGGLLTAPDYTRTCSCNYQNQTSLALIHMPDAEMWTSFGTLDVKDTVRRLGINFGAPGDRRADNRTLWLEYPSVGGKSPAVDIKLTPQNTEWFRRHESQVNGDGPKWVAASGVKGVTGVTIALSKSGEKRRYTVRLHFLEPEKLKPGQRVFDVSLQGQIVLKNLDIVKEAGGMNRGLVKEFKNIEAANELSLSFSPAADAEYRAAILCGIELIAEEAKR